MDSESGKRPSFAEVMYGETPKPAAETDEGKARLQAYHLALGDFVDAFAKVETAMFLTLRYHAKASAPIAKAIFSGTRVETATSFLRRIADIGSMDAADWNELEPIIAHVNEINQTRNTILHHGAQGVAEGRAFVTDALRALREDRMKVFPISPEILDAMTHDCRMIFLRLVSRHMGRPPMRDLHPELDDLLRGAWRYTPERQSQRQPEGKRQRCRK